MVFLPCSDWKMVLACSSWTSASGAAEEEAGLSQQALCQDPPANSRLSQ